MSSYKISCRIVLLFFCFIVFLKVILLSRILVFVCSIGVSAGLGAIFLMPQYFFIISSFIILLISFTVFYILKKKETKYNSFLFLISPLILIFSALAASVFLNNNLLKFSFAILVGIILFLYMENLFSYFHIPTKYNIYSLENISGYINLVSMFFISSSFYGFKISLGIEIISYWFLCLLVIMIFLIVILLLQTFWINKISIKLNKNYIIVISIMLIQIYFIIFFLPSAFYVNSTIFVLSYYIITGLARYKLLNKLEKTVIIKYITVSFIMFLLLLVSTKWI